MGEDRVSSDVADAMVSHLFTERNPSEFDRILYPGLGGSELVNAVHRYCERDKFRTVPHGVAVGEDVDSGLTGEYPDIEVQQVDFLGDTLDLGGEFDFVLCDPPAISWSSLAVERRRAYATNSAVVTTQDESEGIRSDLLYCEPSLRHLTARGRAVFSTDIRHGTDRASARFRELLSRIVEDIFDAGTHEEAVLTVVDNTLGSGADAPFKYHPEHHESVLNERVEAERPFRVEAVMTESPTSYDASTPASTAYIEMMYRDFDAVTVTDDRGAVVGYTSRESIRFDPGTDLRECSRDLSGDVVIPEETHVSDVVTRLGQERFLFVGGGESPTGIVTRFDLNRLPVYLHLFDCFSELEIGLRELIRRDIPDWEARTDVYIPKTATTDLMRDELTTAQLTI